MAIISTYAPKNKFSYFRLNNYSNINEGYSNSFVDFGQMYIGQAQVSASNSGADVGVFGLDLYNLVDRESIKGIESISFTIHSTLTSTGYNGCTARIEYVGTECSNISALWRVGSSSEAITLVEDDYATMTTADISTCTNFENIISNAVPGQYHYFRIARERGMGAWITANAVNESETIRLTITYPGSSAKRTVAYVYTTSGWREATPYVYTSSGWKQVTGYKT